MPTTGSFVRTWAPDKRLAPWVLYDLDRIAWITEMRSGDLTEEEREMVATAARRLLAATSEAPPIRDGDER